MRLPTIVIASVALALAGPIGSAHASNCAGADTAPTADTVGQAAVATVCVLNEKRAEAGRAPVELEMGLTAVGFGYARTLVEQGYFAHVGPSGRDLTDRLAEIGYRAEGAGENLYWGSGMLNTPAAAVKGWMESEEHRINMLDPEYRRIGIGIALGAPVAGVQEAVTYVADFDTGPADSQPSSSPEPAAAESPGAPRSAAGASITPRRLVKRAVRAWMEAGRTGDADAFCRLEDNRMLRAQTGKLNADGLAACRQSFRANPALPPATELAISHLEVDGTRASLTLTVRGARAEVGLRKRNGRWKIDSIGGRSTPKTA
jgi:uncharacterized protein YkwD/ketosteroid isomerase-like protein